MIIKFLMSASSKINKTFELSGYTNNSALQTHAVGLKTTYDNKTG